MLCSNDGSGWIGEDICIVRHCNDETLVTEAAAHGLQRLVNGDAEEEHAER